MTWVKICGLTNLEDALAAVEAGADYLGFIFYPGSRRAVTLDAARSMVQCLRQQPTCPWLVGVFVNAPVAQAAHILDSCQLDLAQLSGDETPNQIGDPASPLWGRAYKALRPASYAEAEAEAEWYQPPAGRQPSLPDLLLDSHQPGHYGGTGRLSDWAMAARLAGRWRLMLAGGLTPANVTQAVQQVRPLAVDVASGVESRPGRKDQAAVRLFIAQVRAADVQRPADL